MKINHFNLAAGLWLVCAAAMPAQQTIRIDCGYAGEMFVSETGEEWLADAHVTGGDGLYTEDPIAGAADPYLYGTARYGLDGDFEYRIPVPDGSYNLTLKFAEIDYWEKGERVFNVTVNGERMLTDFDIVAEAGARTAIDKSFPVMATDGVIHIRFEGVVDFAIVNAIVIEPGVAQGTAFSVHPAEVSLEEGQTAQFMAAAGGVEDRSVTWSASEGEISATGLYTAPSSVTQPRAAVVTASSVADPRRKATAAVKLKTRVAVTVSPRTATVVSGGTLEISAQVSGTSDKRVTWSATSGAVSAAGLFAAPLVTEPAAVTVTAQSVADPSVSGTAQITVNPPGGRLTYIETNGQVSVEAENGEIVNRAQSWVPQNTVAGFSGTSYLTALPNSGINQDADYATVSPEVRFRVKFASTGAYYVWVRGYGAGPADDSVNVGIDGTAPASGARLSQFPNMTPAWAWSNTMMDNAGRVTVEVTTPGVHTINVWMREDGFAFDKILLTTASAYVPSAAGPAESPVDSTPPVLSLSKSDAAFSAAAGSNPAAQTVNVSNVGGGTVSWTAASNRPWLSVSPAAGTDAGALTLSVNTAGMAVGNYTGAVTVSGKATNSPQTVNITLSVTEAPSVPALSVAPLGLSFNATAGGTNPTAQAVSIANAGGGALNWTAAGNQNWLALSAASGTAPSSLSLSVNVTGLSAGTYNGAVTVTAAGAAGSPQTVNVTLNVAAPVTGTGNQWYAAANGTATGDGSMARPWDLATALSGPAAVKPGDTIWLRGGVYGDSRTIFNSRLRGTADAPIKVRQYPGERAVVDGGIATYSPYTWYWGFEIMNSNPDRGPDRGAPECIDTYDGSAGVKIINMVLHDCAQGIGFWIYSPDSEAHGNLIYYNGWQGTGTDRGHGHGIYIQNRDGAKTVSDNIIFDQMGLGIQAYGSDATWVNNLTLDGNVIFNNGSISTGSVLVDNILVAVGSMPKNVRVTNNYTFHTPGLNDGYSRLGWQWSGTNDDLVATGNYWIGGESVIELWNWNRLSFSGNTIYGKDMLEVTLNLAGGQSTSHYAWDNNRYFGSGKFRYAGANQSWAAWKSLAGVDANSSYTPSAPAGVWTFVRPNRYEAGRANITIYNWDLKGSVEVDVSGVMTPGARYEVRDAQNFLGAPVASGTYAGGSISIPMTGLMKAAAVGTCPTAPQHTGPAFGTFVIVSR